MLRFRTILISLLLSAGGWGSFVISQDATEGNADDLWVSAYGWLQTGERLAKAELWPLALGSFIESHRQVEILAERHPAFEPEIISFRKGLLETQIEIAQQKLKPGEQEIMRKYLDFIDSYEEGLRLRFANQYVDSLNTLDIAKVLLDEIIFEKPDEFRDAVESQYQLLHTSLEWLDSQINFKQRSRPAVFVGDGVEWGTTQYVEEKDLPGDGKDILMENALFPGGMVATDLPAAATEILVDVEQASLEKSEKEEEAPTGLPGFRMSSKQSKIPDLPEEVREVE